MSGRIIKKTHHKTKGDLLKTKHKFSLLRFQKQILRKFTDKGLVEFIHSYNRMIEGFNREPIPDGIIDDLRSAICE